MSTSKLISLSVLSPFTRQRSATRRIDCWLSTVAARNVASPRECKEPIRIGIVGGGIAGVSVAHALATKYAKHSPAFHVTVLEGEPQRPNNTGSEEAPWIAATARNANSLVPGSAMHVFSRPSVLWHVFKDTAEEWLGRKFNNNPAIDEDDISQFDKSPPYFALHTFRCLGPSASSSERWSFLNFMRQFLYATLSANSEQRGRKLHQLARANRTAYSNFAASETNGHTQGFLALYRGKNAAIASVKEALDHGEAAVLITDQEELFELEPRLRMLPQSYFAVRRENDATASCETFVKRMIKDSAATGIVDYQQHSGKVSRVEAIPVSPSPSALREKRYYQTTTEDGVSQKFDVLVLATGVATALLAAQLGVSKYCPTFPLRGFSLTAFVEERTNEEASDKNLLCQGFSVDALYCSSVTPNTIRVAGFGEIVGYPAQAQSVPSAGPAVLSRYARRLVPNANHAAPSDALPCFRPMSPDDLPLVGEVPSKEGLFLHTGHGTLGWTCGIATGDCLAQAICDRLNGRDTHEGYFWLADGTEMDRATLSPKRFASRP